MRTCRASRDEHIAEIAIVNSRPAPVYYCDGTEVRDATYCSRTEGGESEEERESEEEKGESGEESEREGVRL